MFGLGVQELLIIFGIILLIFGARRLPELGQSLGQAIKGFKRGVTEEDEEKVATLSEGNGAPLDEAARQKAEHPSTRS